MIDLNVSILDLKMPPIWPSLSQVQPLFFDFVQRELPQLKRIKSLFDINFHEKDDFWIIPPGQVQPLVLEWLKYKYPNPLKRPKILFFLGGEGGKLGYHIWKYKDFFGPGDKWIVACEAEKKLLDYFFPKNSRTKIIHYPVSKNFSPPQDLHEKRKYKKHFKLNESKTWLLYAGRISYQKNIPYLLKLLIKHPHLSLVICGDTDSLGTPHFKKASTQPIALEILHQIEFAKLGDRVEFRPFLSQHDLAKMMKACDYQISLSSHYGEDFGYSIIQGLCSGLKTILSYWGGHRNWQYLEKTKNISYVQLDWSSTKIGLPQIDSIYLPTQNPLNFYNHYHSKIKKDFRELFKKTTFKLPSLQIRGSLNKFWLDHSINNREALFDTPNDKFFKIIRNAYLGKAF